MSFEDRENSDDSGQPILLYFFQNAAGSKRYLYTSRDRDFVLSGLTYLATQISNTGYSVTGDTTTDTFQVTLPIDTEIAQAFQGLPPSETISLRVLRIHDGDDEPVVVWSGIVSSRSQQDEITAVMSCQSLAATFSGGGLRCAWGRGCQHFLYDSECTVNPAAFAQSISVLALDGQDIHVTGLESYADGYFNGGYLDWISDDLTVTRMILIHGGATLRLLGGTYGIVAGMTLTAHPGCDRTAPTCEDKFNNIDNFGGIIHLPGKSPFDGQIVF